MSEPERPPISLEEIVQMAKDGKDAPTIIGQLQAAHMRYDITASQYAKLSRDGVPDAVLDYMQQGQLRMAEALGRREAYNAGWYYGRGWGWGWGWGGPWYPRSYTVYVRNKAYTKEY
jgi:hypothetical protein